MKEKTIYALGFFDGVHLGHRALLAQCKALAQEARAQSGAVTFSGHPDALVLGRAPKLIHSEEDRNALLLETGIQKLVVLPFDKALQRLPWQDFYNLLTEKYGACGFVCGEDFRFGAKGAGTAALLQEKCQENGLFCCVVPQQKIGSQVVSSTHIRALLEQGDIETAIRFLGHPHRLSGVVEKGKQLGRTIGIPTANLAYEENLVQLPYGVYACKAHIGQETFLAVTNIGCRPTVNGQGVTVEAHLPDFGGDLYGKTLTLDFYAFLRREEKFENLALLQAQISKDTLQTRKIMEKL